MVVVAVASTTRCLHVLQLVVSLITALLYNVVRSTLLFVKRRPKSLKGDVVLVIGAGEDLGRALALKLNEEDSSVICVDSDAIRCEETASIINQRNSQRGINRKAYSYHYNVRDQKQAAELAQVVYTQHGRVDILINSSSKFGDEECIVDSISISLHSCFWTILAFLPGMLKRHHGHIVVVSPTAALTGNKTAYSARKLAVQGLLKSLAKELKLDSKFIKLTSAQPYLLESTESLMIPKLIAENAAEEIVQAVRYELDSVVTPQNAFVWQSIMNDLPENISEVWRDALNSRRSQFMDTSLPTWGLPDT